jgi:AcrR family transcriptional regulator
MSGATSEAASAAPRQNSALTLERLVEATLRLVRDVGVERLTMRDLADELGVTPMAAYRHVNGKEELLERALAAAIREEEMANPLEADANWEQFILWRVRRTAHALAKYPGLAAFALSRPASRDLHEGSADLIRILEDAGLSRSDATIAHAALHTYAMGLATMEAQFRRRSRRSNDRALLVDVDLDEYVDFSVGLFLAGIRERIGSLSRGTGRVTTAGPAARSKALPTQGRTRQRTARKR